MVLGFTREKLEPQGELERVEGSWGRTGWLLSRAENGGYRAALHYPVQQRSRAVGAAGGPRVCVGGYVSGYVVRFGSMYMHLCRMQSFLIFFSD